MNFKKRCLGAVLIFSLSACFFLQAQSVTGIGTPYGVKGTVTPEGSCGFLGYSGINSAGVFGVCGTKTLCSGILGFTATSTFGTRYYGVFGTNASGCRGALGYFDYALYGYVGGNDRKGLYVEHNNGAIVYLASKNSAGWFRGPSPNYDWVSIAYSGKGIYAHGEDYAGYFEGDVYVTGDVFAEGTKNNVIQLEDGTWIAMAATESYNPEYTTSGQGKLDNGSVEVEFEYPFPEVISDEVPIRVLVTPKGSWSGIYVTTISKDGFTAVSETGDINATFNYLAIARVKGKDEERNIKALNARMVKRISLREEHIHELKKIDDEYKRVTKIENEIDREPIRMQKEIEKSLKKENKRSTDK